MYLYHAQSARSRSKAVGINWERAKNWEHWAPVWIVVADPWNTPLPHYVTMFTLNLVVLDQMVWATTPFDHHPTPHQPHHTLPLRWGRRLPLRDNSHFADFLVTRSWTSLRGSYELVSRKLRTCQRRREEVETICPIQDREEVGGKWATSPVVSCRCAWTGFPLPIWEFCCYRSNAVWINLGVPKTGSSGGPPLGLGT